MIKQLIIDGKKSYDDFNVYIASRKISSPTKKTIKESVPFSNVVYDFSKINGELYWEERKLEYSFDIAELSTEEMEIAKSNLLNWLLNVHDTDIYDPYIGDYHYHGSYDSDSWDEDFGAGTLNVIFNVYPYKISNSDNNIIEEIGVSDGLIEGNYNIAGLKINGKSEQETRSGKNLCPMSAFDVMGVTGASSIYDNSNHKITIDGDVTSLTGRYVVYEWGLIKGKTYIVSFDIRGTAGKNVSCGWDRNRTHITLTSDYVRYKSVIQATSSNEPLSFYTANNNSLVRGEYMQFANVQIEEGATSTSFEEYGLMPSPDFPSEIKNIEIDNIISHSKQLFNYNGLDTCTIGNVTITNNKDGSFTIEGDGALTENVAKYYSYSHKETVALLKSGTLKFETNEMTYPYLYFQLICDGTPIMNMQNYTSTSGTKEIVDEYLKNDTCYMRIGFFGNLGVEIKSGTLKPMLYQDGNGTWEEYQYNETPLELTLRSLPNGVCDTYKNGVLTRKVGVVTLDGSEKWINNASAYEGFYRYVISFDEVNNSSSSSYGVDGINTHFTQRIKQPHGAYEYLYIQSTKDGGNIFIQCKSHATVTDFKNWLSNNPVTVYYELAAPITEIVELPTITTYNPTIISFDSDLDASFEVYYNDIKTIEINNNSSHRITPTITCTGKLTIEIDGVSYGIGEGIYNNVFYLEQGTNTLKISGYGSITFSYVEELF